MGRFTLINPWQTHSTDKDAAPGRPKGAARKGISLMKYIIVIGDGMSDRPVEALGGRTPLEVARKPVLDALAAKAEVGLVRTTPHGAEPGSDTAHLCLLGYDPRVCYTGRSPLEALGLGVAVEKGDTVFRCNLVTFSPRGDYANWEMTDHSAGKITTGEAKTLLRAIGDSLGGDGLEFHPGVSYRHLMLWKGGCSPVTLRPPHDLLGKAIGDHLPQGEDAGRLRELMRKSYDILSAHPVNAKRERRGLRPANSIWLWGEGTSPDLEDFEKKFGVRASVISAVPLVKGIGRGAGMSVIEVEGATGELNTNYEGKVVAAISALRNGDFVLLHLEAADECGHDGLTEEKVKAIELLDSRILAPLTSALDKGKEPYRLIVMPDHSTPLCVRTHTPEPVPYLLYDSTRALSHNAPLYSERAAAATGLLIDDGTALMPRLLQRT